MSPKPEGYELVASAHTISDSILTEEENAALREAEQMLSNFLNVYFVDLGVDPRGYPDVLDPMMHRALALIPGARQAKSKFDAWTQALMNAGADE